MEKGQASAVEKGVLLLFFMTSMALSKDLLESILATKTKTKRNISANVMHILYYALRWRYYLHLQFLIRIGMLTNHILSNIQALRIFGKKMNYGFILVLEVS